MTKEEKVNLLNELLEYEENNDIGNLTRIERREFQQWISEALEQKSVLDEIKAEIEKKIEQERFARSVFHNEEKDTFKAEQCTGSIFAYNNVIKIIDKYKAERGR